jgi:hypothetical protein
MNFTDVFQMPKLEPENMSVIGLNLFQKLCHLARVANASFDEPMSEDVVSTEWLNLSIIICIC